MLICVVAVTSVWAQSSIAGSTPESSATEELISAARRGDVAAVQAALSKGIDVNAKTLDHKTGLMIAAKNGRLDVLNVLLAHGPNVAATDDDDLAALDFAVSSDNQDVVLALIKHGATTKKILFSAPVDDRHFGMVQLLLENGADVNVRGINSQTPLMWACAKGASGKLVKLLIDHGADVNAKDTGDDFTALYIAITTDKDVVPLLIANHADVNLAEARDGMTPLMLASSYGNAEIAHLLIEAGADVNAARKDGATALALASAGVRPLLEQAGGKPGHTNNLVSAVILHDTAGVRSLLAGGGDPNTLRGFDRTPVLVLASENGDDEIVRDLLAKGASINAIARENKTALMAAAEHGHDRVVQRLLTNGADVNAKSIYGVTALMFGAASGNLEIVRALIAKGADVNAKMVGGADVLRFAHDDSIKAALVRAGAEP